MEKVKVSQILFSHKYSRNLLVCSNSNVYHPTAIVRIHYNRSEFQTSIIEICIMVVCPQYSSCTYNGERFDHCIKLIKGFQETTWSDFIARMESLLHIRRNKSLMQSLMKRKRFGRFILFHDQIIKFYTDCVHLPI